MYFTTSFMWFLMIKGRRGLALDVLWSRISVISCHLRATVALMHATAVSSSRPFHPLFLRSDLIIGVYGMMYTSLRFRDTVGKRFFCGHPGPKVPGGAWDAGFGRDELTDRHGAERCCEQGFGGSDGPVWRGNLSQPSCRKSLKSISRGQTIDYREVKFQSNFLRSRPLPVSDGLKWGVCVDFTECLSC